MYSLTIEDLTHLGGPMGTEYTTMSAPRYFNRLEEAKAAAQKHYGDKQLPEWILERGKIRSQDLGWVMYHIKSVVAE